MKVFALSDPHLALATPGKEMDRFGAHWHEHASKIEEHWRAAVSAEDVVLVTGDISWAMRLEQAKADLEFLARLPGTKILLKGNHDFWWASVQKLRAWLPAGMLALQGDAVRVGEIAVAGTRLWDNPELSFHALINWDPAGPAISPPGDQQDQESLRIFRREQGRLQRAMQHLVQDPVTSAAPLRIAVTHYPPTGPELEPTQETLLFEQHGIRHSVFGHLHAVKQDLDPAPFGERHGVHYHLASCDYIAFRPLLIDEV